MAILIKLDQLPIAFANCATWRAALVTVMRIVPIERVTRQRTFATEQTANIKAIAWLRRCASAHGA